MANHHQLASFVLRDWKDAVEVAVDYVGYAVVAVYVAAVVIYHDHAVEGGERLIDW